MKDSNGKRSLKPPESHSQRISRAGAYTVVIDVARSPWGYW